MGSVDSEELEGSVWGGSGNHPRDCRGRFPIQEAVNWLSPLQVDWAKLCSHCKAVPKEENCGYCKWCKKTYNAAYFQKQKKATRSRPVVIEGMKFDTITAAAKHFKCSNTKIYWMLGEKQRAGRSFYRVECP
jgi:hypothetical protein